MRTKTCKECGTTLPWDSFGKTAGRICPPCVNIRNAAYKKAHPEATRERQRRRRAKRAADPKLRAEDLARQKVKERKRRQDPEHRAKQKAAHAKWYAANRAQERAKQRAYSETHRAEQSASAMRWARANPEKRRLLSLADTSRRRGAKMDRSDKAFAAVLRGDPCCYCGGRGGEVDHIVPVSTAPDGSWTNLTASCRSCNASKSDRRLLSFLAER